MKKYFKKLIVIAMLIILLSGYSSMIYANDDNRQVISIEKSDEYKKWEELTPEERKNTIQPLFSDIKIKDSIKRSNYLNLLNETDSDNGSYKINNIIVKNQQKTGSCWAFSFSSVIETSISKKYNKTSEEYSPMHMDYVTAQSYNRQIGKGGTVMMPVAYSAAGKGPVYEDDFKFTDVYDEENNEQENCYLTDISEVSLNQTPRAVIKDATYFANIYKSYSSDSVTYKDSSALIGYNRYTQEEVEAIRDLIKQQIKEDGAVTAQFYSGDFAIDQNGNYVSQNGYYNPQTKAYYYSGNQVADHAVTIVGWDDTYSKENFAAQHRPVNDGAYIVLNSWGEEFGESGYFYVSYDDAVIEQTIVGIDEIEEYTGERTDTIYQYDELGVNLGIPIVNDQKYYLENGYAANVFTRQNTTATEYLSEIGINLLTAEGIEVYVNAEDGNLNNATTLVASYTGSNALDAGYHTLKLSSPVQLVGDKFVVKIKYINEEGVNISVECNTFESGFTEVKEDDDYASATANQGESFISRDGSTWNDLDNFNYTQMGANIKDTNACIKAFTTKTAEEGNGGASGENVAVTGVKLNKNTATMQVGDEMNLVATIEPTNATNKDVTWTTSNSNVATITEEGIIKAVAEGKTIITVTTEDGNHTASCEITVTKKTNTDDDIYKDDAGDKDNGKSDPADTTKKDPKDDTIADKTIPYAGSKITIIAIISVSILGIIFYKKYKSYSDVK